LTDVGLYVWMRVSLFDWWAFAVFSCILAHRYGGRNCPSKPTRTD